jgi:two-component sensor histidine kinase
VRALLQTVAETLKLSFLDQAAPVELRTSIEPVTLTAADAIPLASLMNEAVTNAYKHAFPERPGEIAVSLQRTVDEALLLQITDNGIGLRGTDKPGLGLELMHAFAAQLGGALVLSTPAGSSGTTLTLTIPCQEESRTTSDISELSPVA